LVVVGYTFVDEGEYIGETDPALMALFPPGDEPDVADRFRRCSPRCRHDEARTHMRAVAHVQPRWRPQLAAPAARTTSSSSAPSLPPTRAPSWSSRPAAQSSPPSGPTTCRRSCRPGTAARRAGPGLVDVLLGDVNPSARLPFTVPVDEADLPAFDRDATTFTYDRWHGWWHLARNGTAPAFPFGFGLSYTVFEVAEVTHVLLDGCVVVRGAVRNLGERDGADVVQVSAELPHADHPPRLVGFVRVEVPAGGSTGFEIVVPVERLATRDSERRAWRPAVGEHRLTVARHAGDRSAHTIEFVL
jgi:beta-glucosidase